MGTTYGSISASRTMESRRPPFTAAPDRRQWPHETFHVYDDRLVSVELVTAQVKINQPGEVALHLKAFEQLRSMAVYGAEARAGRAA